MLCVRVCIVRVSVGLVWLVSHVFHYWWEKDAVCVAFLLVFWITADREMVPILPGASPLYQRFPTASLGGECLLNDPYPAFAGRFAGRIR